MSSNKTIRAVDPARLAVGQWCHRANKTLGEGDIHASYSADRIGMSQPVRKPFTFERQLWVCVSYAPDRSAEAYQLVHPDQFAGEPVSYGEKVRNGDASRADPNGFYHGMSVKHGGTMYVLSGPPMRFVEGQTEQLALF